MSERRIKAIVEYDGANYSGFQRQSTLPSIQGALESALESATGAPSRVSGAGRTDAGAHARGQVVSCLTDTRLDDVTLLRALNAHLPDDIAVQALDTVDSSFDPRRDAVRRRYDYLVVVRPTRSPLWRGRAFNVNRPLDVESMQAAADVLVGVNDFAAFGAPTADGGCTVRELFSLRVIAEGEVVRFEFVGSSFLKQMIRSIVGTLLEVGQGRLQANDLQSILDSRDRSRAAAPVPAAGLYLEHVTYGPNSGLKGSDA